MVTRRRFLGSVALAGSVHFRQGRRDVGAGVLEVERRDELAILHMGLAATTSSMVGAGRLKLPDCCHHGAEVSPDAAFVAWIPDSASPYPLGKAEPLILLKEATKPPRQFRYEGRFGAKVALSAGAMKLAIVSARGPGPLDRFGVYDARTGVLEADLSRLLALISIDRVVLSNIGDVLAVGGRSREDGNDQAVVVDTSSGKNVFEAKCRFPAISPNGVSVAYTDENQRLVVRELRSGVSRTLLRGWYTDGIGSWTPDGTFLLAGVRKGSAGSSRSLVVVDVAADAFWEVGRLGIEDYGNQCLWIKKGFLSP